MRESEHVRVASNVRCADVDGGLSIQPGTASRGSVVAARVVEVGAYDRLENSDGRDVRIRKDDVLVGVVADRFSTTSIYGVVPKEEFPVPGPERLDLLSIGGVMGRCITSPGYLGPATRLEGLGVAVSSGVALKARSVPETSLPAEGPPLFLVVGTAAEVGKTTFACGLVHCLAHRLGLRVGAGKLTGTGRLRDILSMADSGASSVADFVTVGLPTTYGIPSPVVRAAAAAVLEKVSASRPDALVMELGGDVLGANADALLTDPFLQARTTGLIVVPSDLPGAVGARYLLESYKWPKDVWFGQPVRNPRASTELARRVLGCPLLSVTEPDGLDPLLNSCRESLPSARWRVDRENE